MLIVGELFLFALCVALWMPDTPIGKALHHALIDAPARELSHATPLKVIVGLIIFFALIAFVIGAPEMIAFMGIGDFTFCLDITVVTLLVSATLRFKSALAQTMKLARGIAAGIVTQRNRGRTRNRVSRPRRPKSPPSDDEAGAEWDWAFA